MYVALSESLDFLTPPQQKLIKRLEAIEGYIIAVISTSDYEYKKYED